MKNDPLQHEKHPFTSHGGTGFPFVGNSDFDQMAKRVKYANEKGGEKSTPMGKRIGTEEDPVSLG